MSTLRVTAFVLLAVALACAGLTQEQPNIVFKSDVALVRVDAQVLDRGNRAIKGLRQEDFVLSDHGEAVQIRGFASENMPLDVLLLLDVSGSMRPHVQRIAGAAHDAMRVLASEDRVAIMIFDTYARIRMPFRTSRDDVDREFERLLKQEHFNGGTSITGSLYQAINYVQSNARKDARRAIVILTDDETHDSRDEAGIERALARADTVLSFLRAPDDWNQRGHPGGGYPPSGGGPYPGGGRQGGGMGGPLGGIVLGRRGGRSNPGPGPQGYPEPAHSAGTAEIAEQSGGDTMNIDATSALEDTLARLRQRYALYFHLPRGASAGQERSITVDLAPAARDRYPDAEVRYRRVYLAPGGGADSTGPIRVTRAPSPVEPASGNEQPATRRRRVAVDGSDEPKINVVPMPESADADAASKQSTAQKPGWRKATDPAPDSKPAKPGEKQ